MPPVPQCRSLDTADEPRYDIGWTSDDHRDSPMLATVIAHAALMLACLWGCAAADHRRPLFWSAEGGAYVRRAGRPAGMSSTTSSACATCGSGCWRSRLQSCANGGRWRCGLPWARSCVSPTRRLRQARPAGCRRSRFTSAAGWPASLWRPAAGACGNERADSGWADPGVWRGLGRFWTGFLRVGAQSAPAAGAGGSRCCLILRWLARRPGCGEFGRALPVARALERSKDSRQLAIPRL